jgi:hypothetical protein
MTEVFSFGRKPLTIIMRVPFVVNFNHFVEFI